MVPCASEFLALGIKSWISGWHCHGFQRIWFHPDQWEEAGGCLQGVSSCLLRESGRAVRQHLGLVAGAVLVSGDRGAGLGDGCIGPGMEGYTVLQMKGVLSEMRGGLILEVDDMMDPGQSVWCPVGRGCICLMDGG